MDSCAVISDKVSKKDVFPFPRTQVKLKSKTDFIRSFQYLLAMVYTYFRRAELTKREFNRMNFFIAL